MIGLPVETQPNFLLYQLSASPIISFLFSFKNNGMNNRSSLIMSVYIFQVSSSPDPSADVQPSSGQLQLGRGQRVLRRTARMTPLWRTMGTKPYGAYCQNNYECSTGICR